MKKFFYTIVLALVATVAISSCTEEAIRPSGDQGDPCQFGGPGCPKN
jgi:hypothetical protein